MNLLLPLLIAVPLGLLLLVYGLSRAGRFASRWLAVLMLVAIAIDFTPLAKSYIGPVIIWTLIVVVFGYLGIRVLRLSGAQWAEPQTA